MGAYQPFCAWIPKSIVRMWWEPVCRAGFQVVPQPNGEKKNQEAIGMLPNEGDQFSRILSWRGIEVAVDIHRGSHEIHGGFDNWIISIIYRDFDPEVVKRLARIFIASGSRPWFGKSGCKRLYRCKEGQVNSLLIRLLHSYSDHPYTWFMWKGDRDQTGPSEEFPLGTICGEGKTVCFFTGPAIDSLTLNKLDFIAIDYKLPLFRHSKIKKLLLEIDDEFVKEGFVKFDIVRYDPRFQF